MTRRTALGMTLGAAGVALAGCEGGVGDGLGSLGASLVPEQEARQLGDQAFQEIEAKTPIAHDPELQARVERVSKRLLAVSNPEIPPSQWDFVVFDSPEINAFALPGGHVGVYRGMFNVVKNDAQLATVLGHEIGHVLAHHAQQRMGASEVANLGVSALSAALQLGGVQGGQQIASLLGVGAQFGVILPFSRSQEIEADRLGLITMAKAGYDPREAIDFWQRMMQATGRGGSTPTFLSTHPSDQARIARLEELLPEAERIYQQAVG